MFGQVHTLRGALQALLALALVVRVHPTAHFTPAEGTNARGDPDSGLQEVLHYSHLGGLAISQLWDGAIETTAGAVWNGSELLAAELLNSAALHPPAAGEDTEAASVDTEGVDAAPAPGSATCVGVPVRGKVVVEIGAGAGLVGLAAALAGASAVIMTDGSVGLMAQNVAANEGRLPPGSAVKAMRLRWADAEDIAEVQAQVRTAVQQAQAAAGGEPPAGKVLLASDVVYPDFSLPALIATLTALSDANTTIAMAYQDRVPHHTAALDAALDASQFEWRKTACMEPPRRPNGKRRMPATGMDGRPLLWMYELAPGPSFTPQCDLRHRGTDLQDALAGSGTSNIFS